MGDAPALTPSRANQLCIRILWNNVEILISVQLSSSKK